MILTDIVSQCPFSWKCSEEYKVVCTYCELLNAIHVNINRNRNKKDMTQISK